MAPSKLDMLFLQEETPSSYNLTTPKKGNHRDGDTYYSPHYHHVTVSGLHPATTYYYKPVVHQEVEQFQKYNLRTSYAAHPSAGKYSQAFQVSEKASSQDPGIEVRQRHRHLNLPPYDGSEKECPSPDKIRSFKTAPPPGYESVNLAIMGDIGQFPHSEDTIARMIRSKKDIDLLILAGDVAYTGTDHRRWDTFFDFLDDYPITERIPMQVVPGNHDIDKEDQGNEIFLAYEHRFRMPRVQPAQLGVYDGPPGPLNMDQPPYPLSYEWGNAYYSFTYGPARVIMISSYSSMEPNSTQYKWISSELEKVDRSVTPWLLAVLHTPIYNTFSLHQKDKQIIAAKEHLEPLFVKHKVNLVFSGHIHAYLRTTNVIMDEVDPTGPVHITIGAGGRKCEAPFKNAEPEQWVEVRDATIYGYGMFRILNRTTAEWDWIHTGHTDDRDYNQLWKSNDTLPSGPGSDHVFISNQYYP